MRHSNRDARDYQIIEKFEAGIELLGSDVKSLRVSMPQFAGSKVEIKNGVPYLLGVKIPKYKYSQGQIDTTRERRLLLKQKEIAKLISWRNQKYMLIPLGIYLSGKWFKVEIGVGRKMRKYEKREKIRERDERKSGDAKE